MALVLGETAAMAVVPLLWLLPALFALRAVMLRLGLSTLAMGFGLVILPLFALLPGNFAPMRIDHHAPQAVLALVCAALLLSERKLAAILAGLCAAAWLVISLEGLPLVAVIAALYSVRYWLAEQRLLPWFIGSLAAFSAALSLTTRAPAAFIGYCDILLPGHMAAFAGAALAAIAVPFLPGHSSARGRMLGLILLPLVSLPIAVLTLGACATDPMAQLDPVLLKYWHGFIMEGLPVWRQPFSMMLVLIWPIALLAGGWWIAKRAEEFDDKRALSWLVLAAALYSLYLMRAGVISQLLAIPFAAFLIGHYLPRARAIQSALPRIIATLACFGLATPVFASAFAKPLDPHLSQASLRDDAVALVEGDACDYARLGELEPALLLTSFDAAPEILGRTQHSVIAASYHRNQAPMRFVISALVGDVKQAERLVRGSGAQYVVSCSSAGDIAMYRTAAADNFANRLVSGNTPDWLEAVSGFSDGSLRVYRVR